MLVDAGGDPSRGEAWSFAQRLDALKERGSALLVVGAVPQEMYERASRQMLGSESAATPRRRIVVTDTDGRERLTATGPTSPEFARVIVREAAARSAAAATSSPGDGPIPDDTVGPKTHAIDRSIGELGRTLAEVISQFDVAAGGLEPAELRVAFDCLSTLVTEYELETVFRFVHLVAGQVRANDGMIHLRLPRSVDDRTVRLLAPLADAVIELGVDGGRLGQRWHFTDSGFVSEWLAVP